MEKAPSIHIVKRFGPVGGMERYVWELTHALVEAGQPVKVICEQLFEDADSRIEVHQLGKSREKPRWISMLLFSKRVTRWVNDFTEKKDWVIHSHERTAVHHVTTFHGPPIKDRKESWADYLSPRLMTWLYLEKRELLADNVKAILPNSLLISNQLKHFYPRCSSKIRAPAYPGVSPAFYKVDKTAYSMTVGFMGKEWKRKGLDLAVQILTPIQKDNPNFKFIVAGPPITEVQHLFQDWPQDKYKLIEWCDATDFLAQINLLIHPARKEPFGMVIAEANATGIPVLISDDCGIAPLISNSMGRVIPLSDLTKWSQAAKIALDSEHKPEKLNLTWNDLAEKHLTIYRDIIDNGRT